MGPIPFPGRGSADPSLQTAIFVVRAWLEGEPRQLRARLTGSMDLTAETPSRVTTADSVDTILSTLRAWLEEFVR